MPALRALGWQARLLRYGSGSAGKNARPTVGECLRYGSALAGKKGQRHERREAAC